MRKEADGGGRRSVEVKSCNPALSTRLCKLYCACQWGQSDPEEQGRRRHATGGMHEIRPQTSLRRLGNHMPKWSWVCVGPRRQGVRKSLKYQKYPPEGTAL